VLAPWRVFIVRLKIRGRYHTQAWLAAPSKRPRRIDAGRVSLGASLWLSSGWIALWKASAVSTLSGHAHCDEANGDKANGDEANLFTMHRHCLRVHRFARIGTGRRAAQRYLLLVHARRHL
jgi:hypothetical protein